MRSKSKSLSLVAAVAAFTVVAAGCGSKGEQKSSGESDTLTIGASMSLTGKLATVVNHPVTIGRALFRQITSR